MSNKISLSMTDAVAGIRDNDTVMIGGFGSSGIPYHLIEALLDQGASGLTVISNNAGVGEVGIAALLRERRIRRVICSYPRSPGSIWFERLYENDEIELEIVPQGTLAERIRAAGSGIGGFYTPTGYGTRLAENRETRVINDRGYVLELPLHADVALIRAHRADPRGNLVYHATARNFNPVMATAARLTIAEAESIVDAGRIDPEAVVTPGIFVDRVAAITEEK